MTAEVVDIKEVNYPYLEKPLKVVTFSNGHTLILAYKKSPIVNVSSWVKTGSINENNENNGVSHFVEHLLFKGTTKYKAGMFDKTMERNGGLINAATWKDYTFYYINIPKENFEIAFSMHADMMTDALFPIEEIGPAFDPKGKAPEDKRERYVVIEEIKMGQDNNWRKIYKNLNSIMYDSHPYKREVIGTKEIIANISQEEIVRYYKTFYTPENIITIVAGDIEENLVIELAKKEFKFKDNKDIKKCVPDKRTPETKIKNPKTIVDYSNVQAGYLMMGALCDRANNLKETIALDVISTILGDGKSSRLYRDLIEHEKNPYVFQIETSHYQFKEGDNFFIEACFEPKEKDKLLEEIKKQLLNLEKIDKEELEKAKKRTKVDFAREAEMVSTIADAIGHYVTVLGDVELVDKFLKTLDEIDCNYIEEIAKKYLNPEFMSISLLLPEGEK